MTEAAMTPGDQPGNDSVRPSLSLEDAAAFDFHDPEEETVEGEQEQHSERETDEAEEGQESDDDTQDAADSEDDPAEPDDEGEGGKSSTLTLKDDVEIDLNGEKKTLGELKKGYFREADYTRHKQIVSQKERDLQALSARVTQSVSAIAEHLAKQIPPQPDPSLAMTDPNKYVRDKAVHDAAVRSMDELLAGVTEVKTAGDALTAQQRQELISEENAKLSEAFPVTATPEGRKTFFTEAASAARDLGYSDEEIQQVTDHRMFALAHYARIGLRAEQAKAKAKQKVQNAPPVAPAKRQPGPVAGQRQKNADAMKRLSRTGSIHDALAIDFD